VRTAASLVTLLSLLAASCASPRQAPHHLFYLHGRIVQEQQSLRPQHPDWGVYELEQIWSALRDRGFILHAEIRPKEASVRDYADRVVREVRQLLSSGVPPERITIVGASMGASITFLTSIRLQNPDLRFVALGACLSENVRALRDEEGQAPAGHLLVIRESSDELSEPCPAWDPMNMGAKTLDAREMVVHTGLHHGFLFRPLPEWVEPTVAFAER